MVLRKLTSGNEINFVVFTIIIIVIMILLGLGVTYVLNIDKQVYQVEANTFLYDSENIPLEIENGGSMSAKWDGNYYIETNEGETYNVGKQPVIYNKSTGKVGMYGKRYQVFSDAHVETLNDLVEITDFSEDRFYKLDDRKYLIVSNSIKNETETISTKRYLLVILDKAGNTLLLNNEINAKTINSMKIETPTFIFDVANEQLIFDENTIDLTKIIGSTNEYEGDSGIININNDTQNDNIVGENTESASSQTTEGNENTNEGTDTTTITNSNNTTTNFNNSSETIINNNPNSGSDNTNNGNNNNDNNENNNNDDNSDGENNTALEKNVSLRSAVATSSSITISYNVTDPENRYQVVYLNIEGNINETISLDKSNTTYTITGLTPNTNYTITMGAREINTDGTVSDKIEDVFVVRTKKINGQVSITRVNSSKIYFNLKLDSNYRFDSADVVLYVDGIEKSRKQINMSSAVTANGWTSEFNYEYGKNILIRVENAIYEGNSVAVDIQTKMTNY